MAKQLVILIDDCKCEDTHCASEDSFNYAKKGYNSTHWEKQKVMQKSQGFCQRCCALCQGL